VAKLQTLTEKENLPPITASLSLAERGIIEGWLSETIVTTLYSEKVVKLIGCFIINETLYFSCLLKVKK